MNIAIIGSGAAAVGSLIALRKSKFRGKVTVFDIEGCGEWQSLGGHMATPQPISNDRETLGQLYKDIRKSHGFRFPPPKTNFGVIPPKQVVDKERYVWRSDSFGGLTNFWGGGMFPYTGHELKDWPVDVSEMTPWYRLIAEIIGISGNSDGLDEYFGNGFVNRPAIKTASGIQKIERLFHKPADKSLFFDWIAGRSRLALETRSSEANSCEYSGRCMTGCAREAIFSARKFIGAEIKAGFVSHCISTRVTRISKGYVYAGHPPSEEKHGRFDLIFLAAGCLGSTEILMRTHGIVRGPVLHDSRVVSLPVFWWSRAREQEDHHFALSNAVLGCVQNENTNEFIQGSVYPFQDHFWKYFLPEWSWRVINPISQSLRWKVLFFRFVLPAKFDRKYGLELEPDHRDLNYSCLKESAPTEVTQKIRHDLSRLLAYKKNFALVGAPITQGTSSHYGSTFPYHDNLLNIKSDGMVEKGVYLMDSSLFPSVPSISPTFSIMANSARMTELATSG